MADKRFKVTDPSTGESFVLVGAEPPTQEEVATIMSSRSKGRALTPRELGMNALVKLPEETRAKILQKHGIDPESTKQFAWDAVPANLLRGGLMLGEGALGGAAAGPAAPAGAIAGAGAGMLTADEILRMRAMALSGNPEAQAMGLGEMVGASPEYVAQGKSFLEGAGAEAGGRALNPVIGAAGKFGKQVVGQGAEKVGAALTALGGTKIGQKMVNLPGVGMVSEGFQRLVHTPGLIGDYLMENVSKIPDTMKQFIEKRGWRKTMHMFDDDAIKQEAKALGKSVSELTWKERTGVIEKPKHYVNMLADEVEQKVVPAIKNFRKYVGEQVAKEKIAGGLLDPDVKIAMPQPTQFVEQTKAMLDRYTTLPTADKDAIMKTAFRIAGVPQGGGIIKPTSYVEVNDELIMLNRQLASAFKVSSPSNIASMQAQDAAVAELRSMVTKEIYAQNPTLGAKAEQFSKYMNIEDEFEKYVGKDKAQIMNFVVQHMLNDPTTANIWGQRAATELFSPKYLGQGNLEKIKLLVASMAGRVPIVETAGVKTFLVPQLGQAVAGGAGQAVGQAGVMAHITPAITRTVQESREAIGEQFSKIPSRLRALSNARLPYTQGLGQAYDLKSLAGRKVGAFAARGTLDDISNMFGLEVTDEDINQLKAAKL